METLHGRVTSVEWVKYGSELTADAALAATVLSIADAADFDEDGGTLVINDQVVAYVSVVDNDDENVADSITLAAGLAAAAVEGDRLDIYDADAGVVFSELRAEVSPDDELEPGDPLDAVVSDAILNDLPEGVRAAAAESVQLELDEDDDEWYVTRVLGQADHPQDGSRLSPIGLPTPVPTEAPTASPTLTVYSTPTGFIVRATDVDPGTLIDYHISATDGFTPNGTLSVTTAATVVTVNTLADATPLAADTDYYLKAVAHNVVGTAPASAQVTARLNLINSAAVSQIVADLIVGGNLIGAYALLGALAVGPISIDPETGILIPQPGGGMPTQFTTDGVTPNTIAGNAFLEFVTILQGLTLQSDMWVTPGKKIVLADGVGNPSDGPTVTAGAYPSLQLDAATYRFGLVLDGSTYANVHLSDKNARVYDSTTGALLSTHAMPTEFTPYSLTKSGADWYVLGLDSSRSDDYYIYKFNSSWVKTAESLWWSAPRTYSASIGVDAAGNLLIAATSNAGTLVIYCYTAASVGGTLSAVTGFPLTTGVTGSGMTLGVVGTSADFGASRIVVGSIASGGTFYAINPSTGARDTAKEWPVAAATYPYGIWWDGTRFLSSTFDNKVYQYSRNLNTAQDWTYGHYDSVSGDESMNSPRRALTLPRRGWTKVQWPAPPEGADSDRLYWSSTAGGALKRQAEITPGQTEETYDLPSSAGSAPPGSNGFGAGTASDVESGSTDADGPLYAGYSDGTSRAAEQTPEAFAHRKSTTAQTITNGITAWQTVLYPTAVDTQKDVTYATGVFTVEKAGLYAITARARFQADGTGRRAAQLVVNGTEVELDEPTAQSASSIPSLKVSVAAMELAIGDDVEFKVAQSSGGDLGLSVAAGAVTFHMVRLSASP